MPEAGRVAGYSVGVAGTAQSSRRFQEPARFDEAYVRRLAEGDPFVEDHFTAYFGELLYIKLRATVRCREMIDDVRQETFLRVLQAVREKGALEHPERLGAFVNSVCNHVLFEKFREQGRFRPMDPGSDDWPDNRVNLDAPLVDEERCQLVETVLAELSKRDRELLRMVLDGVEAEEACRRLEVEEGYLRVLLHRAKLRFRKKLAGGRGSVRSRFASWIRRDPVKQKGRAVHYKVRYSNGT